MNAVPDFIVEATAAVEAMIPAADPFPSHLGDGSGIHYNVSQPVGADRASFPARWDEVNDAVFASWQSSAAPSRPSTASVS